MGVLFFNDVGEMVGVGVVIVLISDVYFLYDWDVVGFCGSGSMNVIMENVFIFVECIIDMVVCMEGC